MRAAPKDRPTTSPPTQDQRTAADQEQLDLLAYQRQIAESARAAGETRSHRSDPDGFAAALSTIVVIADEGWAFTSDDLRSRLGPGYEGVLGAAFATARRNGWIEAVGFEISRAVSRHGGLLRSWRKAVPMGNTDDAARQRKAGS